MTGEEHLENHTNTFLFVRVWGEESQHFQVAVGLTLSFPASLVPPKFVNKMTKSRVCMFTAPTKCVYVPVHCSVYLFFLSCRFGQGFTCFCFCALLRFFWSELCTLSCANYQESEVFAFVDAFEPCCFTIEACVAQLCLAYVNLSFYKGYALSVCRNFRVSLKCYHGAMTNSRTFFVIFLNKLV